MPRKTKEPKENEEIKESVEKATKKTAKKTVQKAEKNSTKVKKVTEKKDTSKTRKVAEQSKSKSTKKAEKETKKTTSKKSSSKTVASKKSAEKVEKDSENQPAKKTANRTARKTSTTNTTNTTKKSTTKKVTTKKASSAKKTTSTKKTTSKKSQKIEVVEYYDLPYRYNQTVVKLLAQTPKTLFIYWDISDNDREYYKKKYGEYFFENSKPILIVHNDTLNYSYEVEINDFANSWYLHINDSNCDYRIELGRKAISNTEKLQINDYIYVTTSNGIESPNDRILFDKLQDIVYFRDIKTGKVTPKKISNLHFKKNIGKIYNIYDIFRALYNDENIEEIYDLSNPSSRGNPSSSRNPSSGGII